MTGWFSGAGTFPGPGYYGTLAYSGAGVPLWTNLYSRGLGDDGAFPLAVDRNGNVFVTGHSYNGDYSEYATVGYSGAGVALWTNIYHGESTNYDVARCIAVYGTGNITVTGFSSNPDGSLDYATVSYSNAGVPLWTNRYHGDVTGSDDETGIAVDTAGNVFVTGYSSGTAGETRFATVAYSNLGVPL